MTKEPELVNVDEDLYLYILSNIEDLSPSYLNYLLDQHDLNVMAKMLKRKFEYSSHTHAQLKQMVMEELL